jgi:hypothetical protein
MRRDMRAALTALAAALVVALAPLERSLTRVLVTRELRRWLVWLLSLCADLADWLRGLTGC